MEPWVAEGYRYARFHFQRGLAVIYPLAFLVAVRQFRPLADETCLLPLERYVDAGAFEERPCRLSLVPSDRAIAFAAWSGVVFAVAALVGVPYWLPEPCAVPASVLLWATMWLLYHSFVNAGQLPLRQPVGVDAPADGLPGGLPRRGRDLALSRRAASPSTPYRQ